MISNFYHLNSKSYIFILLLCTLCSSNMAIAASKPASAIDTQVAPSTVIRAQDSANKPLPYYKLSDNTYFLYGNIAEVDSKNRGFNGNAGFVVTQEGVVVIDSLGTPKLGKRLIATIRQVTRKPIKYLVITHNHPDHSYGAIAFKTIPGIRIVGHAGTLEYLDSDGFEGSVAFRNKLIAPDMQGFAGVKPDILVNDKRFKAHSISLGGKTFDIYNTGRHHSYGDLVVHQVEDKQLWISDLAFNNRSTFMGDGHSGEIIESVDWLRKSFTDIKLMIPGHGSAQTAPFPMVEKTYNYVKRLRDEMRAAIESGLDLASAVSRSDFADWHGVPLYEENHRKNANFVYLELEQEAFFGK